METDKDPGTTEVTLVSFPVDGNEKQVSVEVREKTPSPTPPPKPPRKNKTKTESMVYDEETSYHQLLERHHLFHFVMAGKDKRALLVDSTSTTDQILKSLAKTYGILDIESYNLWIPQGVEHLYQPQEGSHSSTRWPKAVLSSKEKTEKTKRVLHGHLDKSKPLKDQYNFAYKPYILHVSKTAPGEHVDSPEDDEMGEEWPDFEEPQQQLQRRFEQSWYGIVQGDYPVNRKTAIKVAALLTQIYYGDYTPSPLSRYDSQVFLSTAYKKSPNILTEIEQEHQTLVGKTRREVMEEVVGICESWLTYEGLFFNVERLIQSLPWKKVKLRILGVNHQGLIEVDPKTGEVTFVHRFSDIHDGCVATDLLHIGFRYWDQDYDAYTPQAREFLAMLRLYITMTQQGHIQQAPSKPLT